MLIVRRPLVVLLVAALTLTTIGAAAPAVSAAEPASVAVGDATAPEGNVVRATGKVEVRLSDPVATDTYVFYTTSGGTALAGTDFVARSSRVRIRAGKTTGTISVPILSDALVEGDETVIVSLTAAGGLPLADSTGVVTIRDDEGSTGVSIGDVAVWEGDTGLGAAKIGVVLDAPQATDTYVDYTTLDGTAVGSSEFKPKTRRVRIRAGKTAATIAIVTLPDTKDEPDEEFTVMITGTGTSGVPIEDGIAAVTVRDDDASTAPQPPAAPPNLVLTGTAIFWDEPASDLPITRYEVHQSDNGGTNWTFVDDTTNLHMSACDLCLMRVRAWSALGPGAWSTIDIQNARPTAPTNLTAVRDALDPELVHLSWSAPLDEGSYPVDSYEVIIGGVPPTVVTDMTLDVRLRTNLNWSISVFATNLAGNSYTPATTFLPPL